MEQTDSKSIDRLFRFYLTLGLSIYPASWLIIGLLSNILLLDSQILEIVHAASSWLSLVVGVWCIYRWLVISHKPSPERAIKFGLLIMLYFVWFGFCGFFLVGLTG